MSSHLPGRRSPVLPYHALSEEDYARLGEFVAHDEIGEEFALACNADAGDHLHTVRIGPKGSGLEGRVAVKVHDAEGRQLIVYLAASDARSLAAHLLNFADELDGYEPLMFWHPDEAGDIEADPR
jgi:hypothetical protein